MYCLAHFVMLEPDQDREQFVHVMAGAVLGIEPDKDNLLVGAVEAAGAVW